MVLKPSLGETKNDVTVSSLPRHCTVNGKKDALSVVQDLLATIQNILSGSATISQNQTEDNETSKFKIKTSEDKPIVILKYKQGNDDLKSTAISKRPGVVTVSLDRLGKGNPVVTDIAQIKMPHSESVNLRLKKEDPSPKQKSTVSKNPLTHSNKKNTLPSHETVVKKEAPDTSQEIKKNQHFKDEAEEKQDNHSKIAQNTSNFQKTKVKPKTPVVDNKPPPLKIHPKRSNSPKKIVLTDWELAALTKAILKHYENSPQFKSAVKNDHKSNSSSVPTHKVGSTKKNIPDKVNKVSCTCSSTGTCKSCRTAKTNLQAKPVTNEKNINSRILIVPKEPVLWCSFYPCALNQKNDSTEDEEKIRVVYKCPKCEKIFLTPNERTDHMLVHSNSEKSSAYYYYCKYCSGKFCSKLDREKHELVHEIGKVQSVEIKDANLSVRPEIDKVNATPVSEKLHLCTYCNLSFSQVADKKAHERIHVGEMPYKCKDCGKRFRHMSVFNRHKVNHTDEQPNQCQYCDKSFSRISSKQQHEKNHERK